MSYALSDAYIFGLSCGTLIFSLNNGKFSVRDTERQRYHVRESERELAFALLSHPCRIVYVGADDVVFPNTPSVDWPISELGLVARVEQGMCELKHKDVRVWWSILREYF